MSWTYLEIDDDLEPIPGSAVLPGPSTAYLGFDAIRNAIVIGYTERGGYYCFFDPNVNDDCKIVAFAPFGETETLDIGRIRKQTPFKNVYLDLNGAPYKLFA